MCHAAGMVPVPAPAAGDCTVWWAAPVDPATAPHLVRLLDGHERERLGRFRRPVDRARYLAAHALARLVLAEVSATAPDALVFDRTCHCGAPHGKPRLAGPRITADAPGFSLSHAGNLVGVAVRPDGPVGLDVEQVRPMGDLAATAAHVQSPAERRRGAHPDADGFFLMWTRKEALLKATGSGLSTPMTTITLAPDGAVQEWTGEDAPAGPVWLRDLRPAPDHYGAVAGPGPRPPRIREADGDAVLRAAS